jgi:hypothetical protein
MMIEFIGATASAGMFGFFSAVVLLRRRARAQQDERAQVIAMGEGMGIEYVPGEDFDEYRAEVVRERDRRSRAASAKFLAEERESGRRRDAKGRFL